jgi:hypothetical protein
MALATAWFVEEYDEGTWHGLVRLGALHYYVLYIHKQAKQYFFLMSDEVKT